MSQNFSYCPSEMQFTTCAVTLCRAGRPSNRTRVPIFNERPNFRPQPWGFTRTTKQGSKKRRAESRVIRVSRISQAILVPCRRLAVGRVFEEKESESRGIAITPNFASANPEEDAWRSDRRKQLDFAETLWPFPQRHCLISGRSIFSYDVPLWRSSSFNN